MVEISEEDWKKVSEGIEKLEKGVANLKLPDTSDLATKKDVELCIGPHCEKLSGRIDELGTNTKNLQGEIDHLSELVHKKVKPAKASLAEARARAAAQQQKGDKHTHPSFEDIANCPECYPELRKAIEPKLTEEGVHLEALKLSDRARKALRGKGVPICTDCGFPWEDEAKEKCDNCGGGK